MNNNFSILFYSKDKNLRICIQDYFKKTTFSLNVFEEETTAFQNFQSGKFNICLIDYIPEDNKAQQLAIMIKSSEKTIPVIFLCDHPTREDISFLFSLQNSFVGGYKRGIFPVLFYPLPGVHSFGTPT